MQLIKFPEQNTVFAEDQPEYLPLPAYKAPGQRYDGKITFCWHLSITERIKLLFFGRIWHQILTFNSPLQPQLLPISKPNMESDI